MVPLASFLGVRPLIPRGQVIYVDPLVKLHRDGTEALTTDHLIGKTITASVVVRRPNFSGKNPFFVKLYVHYTPLYASGSRNPPPPPSDSVTKLVLRQTLQSVYPNVIEELDTSLPRSESSASNISTHRNGFPSVHPSINISI